MKHFFFTFAMWCFSVGWSSLYFSRLEKLMLVCFYRGSFCACSSSDLFAPFLRVSFCQASLFGDEIRFRWRNILMALSRSDQSRSRFEYRWRWPFWVVSFFFVSLPSWVLGLTWLSPFFCFLWFVLASSSALAWFCSLHLWWIFYHAWDRFFCTFRSIELLIFALLCIIKSTWRQLARLALTLSWVLGPEPKDGVPDCRTLV